MDQEKKKQESELERALKERIDRRKKQLENKHKKEINAEIKDREKELLDDIDREKESKYLLLDSEIQ